MKTCLRCQEHLHKSCFRIRNPKTGLLSSYCKACQRQISREHYQANRGAHKLRVQRNSKARGIENREWYAQLKSTLKCNRCGEDHIATLDFHHSEPSDKEQTISAMLYSWNREAIQREMAKCEVICSNCHRKHHWKERQ